MNSNYIAEDDLKILKCLVAPPNVVKKAMLATYAILINEIPLWEKTKKLFMDHRSLKAMIDNYDVYGIDPATFEILEDYVKSPGFNVKSAHMSSAASAGLMMWILNVYSKEAQQKR